MANSRSLPGQYQPEARSTGACASIKFDRHNGKQLIYVRYRRFIYFRDAAHPDFFDSSDCKCVMFSSGRQIVLLLLLPVLVCSATVTYTIPASAPSKAAALDPAPLGISYVHPAN
jgi:hypothetical protein